MVLPSQNLVDLYQKKNVETFYLVRIGVSYSFCVNRTKIG